MLFLAVRVLSLALVTDAGALFTRSRALPPFLLEAKIAFHSCARVLASQCLSNNLLQLRFRRRRLNSFTNKKV